MTLQFHFAMNAVMISRLIFLFNDGALSKKELTFMILLQVAGLLIYEAGYTLILLIVILLLVSISFYLLEKKTKRFTEFRLLSFLLYIIILSVFFSTGISLKLNSGLIRVLQDLGQYSVFFDVSKKINWLELNIVLNGLFVVTNEINFLLRYIIQLLDLVPKRKEEPRGIVMIDRREYNAGRVIGILERVFTYLFVLNNEFTAIGFVLAAKGFARFKEMEQREFAEYVLIGTLFSILFAILIALTVKVIL